MSAALRPLAATLAAAAPIVATPTAHARVTLEVGATSYCLAGRMADGTFVRLRSAASNRHPLGTRIRIVGTHAGPGGLRRWVVRDRIGHGSALDLWAPSCATAVRFGRRAVRYRIGWAR